MRSNFFACLKDANDNVIRGSERRGHNIFTDYGREWLSYLMPWRSIDVDVPPNDDDVPFTNWRVRWLGVGAGTNPLISTVSTLNTPLPITTGPDVYLGELDSPATFPTITSVRFKRTFGPAELGAVTITEAGLFIGKEPEDAGSDASVETWGAWNMVTGLEGLTPLVVGRNLTIYNGDNPGTYEILTFINETTVHVDGAPFSTPDAGNPNIQWSVDTDLSVGTNKPVAYKTFEGLVKIPGFSLEIEWDFRF